MWLIARFFCLFVHFFQKTTLIKHVQRQEHVLKLQQAGLLSQTLPLGMDAFVKLMRMCYTSSWKRLHIAFILTQDHMALLLIKNKCPKSFLFTTTKVFS